MYDIDRFVEEGRTALAAGRRDEACDLFVSAMRKVNRYGPAKQLTDVIAKDIFAEAIAVRDRRDTEGAIALLVRSIELNPDSGETRGELARLMGLRKPARDLTTECLIFPDAARADKFYRDAIQTCMDFIVYSGIEGDILEFGVLAGWTARRFAETMRDMHFFGDLHLFDSFEGLPLSKSDVDARSYDVTRGVWKEEMKLPDAWTDEIGMSIDQHVVWSLSHVISRSRLHVRRGFFSETLKEKLNTKAALVHLDCDLYESTVDVLSALHRDDVLVDGTVMMFDDWNCNRANPAFGQRRAFREFLDTHSAIYSASHYLNYGFNCAAFILHRNI
ncbi:MAG: TylF/MycF/NovP-related O-methyltransferase [Parvibaculaceae bacterium]